MLLITIYVFFNLCCLLINSYLGILNLLFLQINNIWKPIFSIIKLWSFIYFHIRCQIKFIWFFPKASMSIGFSLRCVKNVLELCFVFILNLNLFTIFRTFNRCIWYFAWNFKVYSRFLSFRTELWKCINFFGHLLDLRWWPFSLILLMPIKFQVLNVIDCWWPRANNCRKFTTLFFARFWFWQLIFIIIHHFWLLLLLF
jgi:hypothetical protein